MFVGSLRLRLLLVAIAMVPLLTGCDRFMSSGSRLERAAKSEEQGDFAAAAIDVSKVVQAEPANLAARLKLAALQLQLGDVRAADFELQKALAGGANPVETAPLRTDIAIAMGQFEPLIAWLRGPGASVPEPTHSILLGRALTAAGRSPEAQKLFENVLAGAQDSVPGRTGLAETLAFQGRYDPALQQIAPVVDGNAPAIDARLLQARIFLARGQYADAERSLIRAREIAGRQIALPKLALLLYGLAEAQLAQGHVADAAKTSGTLSSLAPNSVPSRLVSARVALAKGEYVTGIAELQRVVSSVPDLVQARMMLGAAHFAQGNYMQASTQLERVVQEAPDNVEARKLLARVELQLDRPDAALRTISPALESSPTDSQLYALAGEANVRGGSPDRAFEVLERNVKANPDDVNAKLDLATAYLQAHRYDSAITLVRALPPQPGNVRREALLITALMAGQGPIVARRELEELLKQRGDSADLHYLAAAFFATQREFERSKAEIDIVRKQNPNDIRSLVMLAKTEFASGKRPPAEAALQEALKIDPKSTVARLMLAQLYVAGADVPRARTVLDAAIAAAPNNVDVVHSSGLILLDAGLVDEALARFRRATELEPNNATYWLSSARAQSALNQPAAARESVAKALVLRPKWVAAQSLLVMLDLRASGPDAALARAAELRTSRPDDPLPVILVGDVHMFAHHYEEAAKAYTDATRLTQDSTLAIKLFEAVRLANRDRPEQSLERWLGLRPDDARARLVLAQYFSNIGRTDRAISEFEILVRQLPDEAPLLNNLAWLYHTKRDARAEGLARRAHEIAPNNAAITDTYGWILFTANKVEQSLELLKAAAAGARDNPSVSYHYGAALAAAGKPAEARTALAAALGSSTKFEERPAAEKLAAQLQKQG